MQQRLLSATLCLALVAAWGCDKPPAARSGPDIGENTPVTANVPSPPQAHNSPAIAVDPTDDRFLVLVNRIDAPEFDCSFQASGDGGRSWLPVEPLRRIPEGVDRCYGPEVAFDRDGILYYLFVGLQGVGNVPKGVFLTTSPDRGRTFTAPRRLLGENAFQVRLAIDLEQGRNGRIHMVWIKANTDPPLGGFPVPPNPILASFSDDGGRTFSRPSQVNDPEREFVVAPALAVARGGKVHLLYYDLGEDAIDYHGLEGAPWEGNWSLVLHSSDEDGKRFGPGEVIDSDVVPPGRVMLIFTMPPPALAAGPDGRLYAAWHDARNGDWDAFLRSSRDGGKTWSRARRLNDDPPGNGSHQYLPRLSVSPGGRLDAIFYDRRLDPGNLLNDVFYTYSENAGKRFLRNRRLTSFSSDSRIGERYPIPSATGQVDFGSRLGLVSLDGATLAAWTDTQHARSSRHQDIYSSRIELPERQRAAGALPVAAAAAVALGLAGAGLRRAGRRRSAGVTQSGDQKQGV